MTIQPYLFFEGRCAEALDFYEQALGAKILMRMTHDQSPEEPPPGVLADGWEGKIMHAAFEVEGALVMVSDGGKPTDHGFHGFFLSLTAPDAATADRYFAALCEGGQVVMPMGETFWSKRFGMVHDRFGVGWMVTIPMEEQ